MNQIAQHHHVQHCHSRICVTMFRYRGVMMIHPNMGRIRNSLHDDYSINAMGMLHLVI